MGFQQRLEVEPLPQRGARHSEEPGEAVCPVRQMRHEAQQYVNQQRGIHLPAHRVGALPHKIGKPQALFDLLEEDLDVPAAAVEVAHRLRTPFEIVGHEHHHPPLAIDFHPCLDTPDLHALVPPLKRHDLIPEDVGVALGEIPNRAPFQVFLGSGDPPHAAQGEVKQVEEIHIGLVKHHDFPSQNARANLPRPRAVVLGGSVDHGERWQEAVQVETQVHFGGSLAAAVFGPVHAACHQLDDRRIHGVDAHLEAPQQPLALLARGEGRAGVLAMTEHRPEELLDEKRVALLVGVGEGVPGRWGDSEAGERLGLEPKPITDIIESHRVGELGEKHRGEVALDAEGACFALNAGLAGMPADQMARNEVENLVEDDYVGAGWRGFVHTHPTEWQGIQLNASPLLPSPVMPSRGMAVKSCFWQPSSLH